jgi:chlorobactene glucosyltransferase
LIVIALLTYFFLLVRYIVTLVNFLSKPLLPHSSHTYTEKISILVPARNEARNLPLLLDSILRQDYSNYELLILDDDSTDDTAGIIQHYTAKDRRIKLLTGQPLPADWLGKNWACHQLAKQATCAYLLFIDADVQIFPGFIQAALREMKLKKLSLLSVFNDQIMLSAGEKMVVPLMHYLLLTLLPLRLVNITKDYRIAAASGQCMFFEAEAYQLHRFHQQAKNEVVEDMYIMKLVKRLNLKTAACLANGLIKCRMYQSYKEGLLGFSKNLMAGFNNSIWFTSLFVALLSLCYLSFFSDALLSLLSNQWMQYVLYGSLLFFIISIRMMVSVLSNQNIFINLLFHPLQIVTLLVLLVISIYKQLTHSNRWKGRLISTK